MSEFNITLLREKFVIRDALPAAGRDNKPVTALSNRMVLPLYNARRKLNETLVIRAHNMHCCVRLAAHIARDFQENGSIFEREKPFDWRYASIIVTKAFEREWNPENWMTVYHQGKVVYEEGAKGRHPLLDIIEQCDSRNKGDYEQAITVAEDAFKQAGKLVTIEHDSNVALVMNVTEEEGKCGVIVRAPNKTMTFNMTAKKRADRLVRPTQMLTTAAAFLEGIQLAFYIGLTRQKIRFELISATSHDAKRAEAAVQRISRLNAAIAQFENLLHVTYRPEQPDFTTMIEEAEDFARKMFSADIMEHGVRKTPV